MIVDYGLQLGHAEFDLRLDVNLTMKFTLPIILVCVTALSGCASSVGPGERFSSHLQTLHTYPIANYWVRLS